LEDNGFIFLLAGFAFYNGQVEAKEVSLEQKEEVILMSERPVYLYKVLSLENWEKSSKTVHLSDMDADFIHLATKEQLDQILEKYWGKASQYVVLKLETAKLSGNLVLEANPGGSNKYYHLYNGSIPRSAIVEVTIHGK
jgi:uncharacterized protein (DUF952 family)